MRHYYTKQNNRKHLFKTLKTLNTGEDAKQWSHLPIAGGNVIATLEKIWQFLKKINK